MNKTKRFQYSMEAMEQAVDAVQNGMPTAQASKLFKVPRTTIIGKVKGEAPIERKIGPDTVLTSDEEKLLVKWMFHIATCGFPATKLPSPFKKTLFWPTPKPNTTKRKITEKVPAVASSKEWQEYFKRKEEKKNIELAKKEQCAQKRKERQAAKAELQNKKMKKAKDERKLVEEQNDIQEKSSSNENIIENNEESEKTLKDSNSQELSINDYVIVNYNEQPLPGKIIGISCKENGEFEYKVSHMEKNGLNWIWPKRFDILWYDRDKVLEKIKEPKIKNKRGLYCVPEISDSVFI